MSGRLTLITVPIGNLDDLTVRAADALKSGKEFFAEDTRNFIKLQQLLGRPASDFKVESFHDHSKEKIPGILSRLDSGSQIYLVSDAGSPIISDPAHPLIVEAINSGFEVDTIPGVSAPLVALELSGLPPTPFLFSGFLPREDAKKRSLFEGLEGGVTYIFFESPHRIRKTLNVLSFVWPVADVVVARELTKKFQSVYRFKAENWEEYIPSGVKGEVVLLLRLEQSIKKEDPQVGKLRELAQTYLDRPRPKILAKIIGHILGKDVNEIYLNMGKK